MHEKDIVWSKITQCQCEREMKQHDSKGVEMQRRKQSTS